MGKKIKAEKKFSKPYVPNMHNLKVSCKFIMFYLFRVYLCIKKKIKISCVNEGKLFYAYEACRTFYGKNCT